MFIIVLWVIGLYFPPQETVENLKDPNYGVTSVLYNELKEFVMTELIAFAPYRIGAFDRLRISTFLEAK